MKIDGFITKSTSIGIVNVVMCKSKSMEVTIKCKVSKKLNDVVKHFVTKFLTAHS